MVHIALPDKAASDPGSNRQAEHAVSALRGAEHGLRQAGAVDIILDLTGQACFRLNDGLELRPGIVRNVGTRVKNPPLSGVHHPCRGDADPVCLFSARCERRDDLQDLLHDPRSAKPGFRRPLPFLKKMSGLSFHQAVLDVCPSNIDGNESVHSHPHAARCYRLQVLRPCVPDHPGSLRHGLFILRDKRGKRTPDIADVQFLIAAQNLLDHSIHIAMR